MSNLEFTSIANDSILESFEKGKKAQIGEVHDWNGRKFRKTAQGWKQVANAEDKAPSTEELEERYEHYSPKAFLRVVDSVKETISSCEYSIRNAGALRKSGFFDEEAYRKVVSSQEAVMADKKQWLENAKPLIDRAINFDRSKQFMQVKEWDKLTPEKVEEVFNKYNDDEDVKDLSKQVFSIVKEMKIPIGVGNLTKHKAAGLFKFSGIIIYDQKIFNEFETSMHRFTGTLLHECIHACTSMYLNAYEKGYPLPEEIKSACEELNEIHRAAKSQLGDAYGATDTHEMVAELANRKFRMQLQSVGLWQRVKASLARMFYGREVKGTIKVDALQRVEDALQRILDNASTDWVNMSMAYEYDRQVRHGVRHTHPRPESPLYPKK